MPKKIVLTFPILANLTNDDDELQGLAEILRIDIVDNIKAMQIEEGLEIFDLTSTTCSLEAV